jgi:hypothetical protein
MTEGGRYSPFLKSGQWLEVKKAMKQLINLIMASKVTPEGSAHLRAFCALLVWPTALIGVNWFLGSRMVGDIPPKNFTQEGILRNVLGGGAD